MKELLGFHSWWGRGVLTAAALAHELVCASTVALSQQQLLGASAVVLSQQQPLQITCWPLVLQLYFQSSSLTHPTPHPIPIPLAQQETLLAKAACSMQLHKALPSNPSKQQATDKAHAHCHPKSLSTFAGTKLVKTPFLMSLASLTAIWQVSRLQTTPPAISNVPFQMDRLQTTPPALSNVPFQMGRLQMHPSCNFTCAFSNGH